MFKENTKNAFIGSIIKNKRISQNLSQVKLATNLDISPSYLNLIEKGKRTLRSNLLSKIIVKLKLSKQDFILDHNREIISLLRDFFSNKILEKSKINEGDIDNLINTSPKIVKALLLLNELRQINSKKIKITNKTETYLSERYGLVLRKSID